MGLGLVYDLTAPGLVLNVRTPGPELEVLLVVGVENPGTRFLCLRAVRGGVFHRYLRQGNLSELAWLEELLGWVTVYPVDEGAAEVAARVKAEAAAKDLQLPNVDLPIAASADPGTIPLTFDSDDARSDHFSCL